MSAPRIMLFGAGGQVGQAFQHLIPQDVFPKEWEWGFFARKECDITDPAALRTAIQSFSPSLIINAAALTNVDGAEKDEVLADKVNFHAVAQMAAQCSALDIPLIHISTDYVFDGRATEPYREDDQMNPINRYGASKVMGEEAVRHELPFHVILRVASVFSAFAGNILPRSLQWIEQKEEIRMVTDIVSPPTPATAIARACGVIGQALLAGKTDGYGTFHFCGTPVCSRFDFMKALIDASEPFIANRPRLLPALCADFPGGAARPAYSALNCEKIERVYGIKQPAWQDGITEALDLLYKDQGKR